MKKKLLVILGAGSSIDQGMPSVGDLDECMKKWSADWFRCDPAMPQNLDNYFEELWNCEDKYYEESFLSYRTKPNFEKILGDLLGLAHWMAPAPRGNPLRKFVSENGWPVGLRYRFDRMRAPYGANVMINWQHAYLLSCLAQHIREICRHFDSSSRSYSQYQQLLEVLQDQFEIGIYNLNYDNLALTAFPGAFTGFSNQGEFCPAQVHERSDWGFVYHLHGSVHHTLSGSSSGPIRWQESLDSKFTDGQQGQAINKMSDGKSFPFASLVAGGFKLDHLLIEPYHSLYAAFVRHIHQADAILIAGYGFGDEHVNKILQNRLEDSVWRRNSIRPPIVVLTKSNDGECPMDIRQDNWGMSVKQTLFCPVGFEVDQLGPSRNDGRLLSRSFETSVTARVSIWHGGFCEAAEFSERIRQFLETGGG